MAWKPGETGNPDGARKHKVFYAALHRAITQEDGKRVRDAAEKLLDLAAAGDGWAIKELRNTLDGKPEQATSIEHSGNIGLANVLASIGSKSDD